MTVAYPSCIEEEFDVTYHITGFNSAGIQRYLQVFCKYNEITTTPKNSNTAVSVHMPCLEVAEQIVDEIEKQPILFGLLAIPINLRMFCHLRLQKPDNNYGSLFM